jgi:hypothetical protein
MLAKIEGAQWPSLDSNGAIAGEPAATVPNTLRSHDVYFYDRDDAARARFLEQDRIVRLVRFLALTMPSDVEQVTGTPIYCM